MWKKFKVPSQLPEENLFEVLDDHKAVKKHAIGINLAIFYPKLVKQIFKFRDKIRSLEQEVSSVHLLQQENKRIEADYDTMKDQNEQFANEIKNLKHSLTQSQDSQHVAIPTTDTTASTHNVSQSNVNEQEKNTQLKTDYDTMKDQNEQFANEIKRLKHSLAQSQDSQHVAIPTTDTTASTHNVSQSIVDEQEEVSYVKTEERTVDETGEPGQLYQ